jgi:hypothetical protein
MNNSVVLAVTLRSFINVYGRFGEMYCLHLQDQRISRASKQVASSDEASVELCQFREYAFLGCYIYNFNIFCNLFISKSCKV